MNGYDLSRNWFDFAFENPEKVSPCHAAIYFFAIEHCNRLGWREKFGFPTQMAMDALGIKKHQTYIKYFNNLVEWGFFVMIQKSKNQYSANIISLSNGLPKNGNALDKAIGKHRAKQTESNGQSTGQSKDSIDKPENQGTKEPGNGGSLPKKTPPSIDIRRMDFEKETHAYATSKNIPISTVETFVSHWTQYNPAKTKMKWEMEKAFSVPHRLGTWMRVEREIDARKNGDSKQNRNLKSIIEDPMWNRP